MKKILSILSISLLLLVSITTIPPTVFAQTPSTANNPRLHVSWNRVHETDSQTFDSTLQEWVFGETMKLVITNESGINIEENDYKASRGSPLTFTLIIPKRFFERGTELDSAAVGAAFHDIGSRAEVTMYYHVASNTWYAFSGIYDSTGSSPSDPAEFFNLYPLSCDFTEDTRSFNVSFVGTFNMSAPIGVYNTWAQAMDNASNYLTPNWYNYQMTGRVSMPPIALDCELGGDWWRWQTPPKYDFRILNEALDPIRYAEANETVIFEMVMDQEIGFAAFEIGQVASWEQQFYWKNMTWYEPDNYYNHATTWSSFEVPQPPHLGFYYNESVDVAEAFIFYYNITWVWQDYGGGSGYWNGYEFPVIDNTNITHFVDYNAAASGLVTPHIVRWYTNFTTNVCARGIHLANTTDNTGETSTPGPYLFGPNYLGETYGTTFHIYSWQPRHWGTQSKSGVPAEPSFAFSRAGDRILALHDVLLDGYLYNLPGGTIVDQLNHNDWFNVSIDVYAPIELIEKKGEPFEHPDYPGVFLREDLNCTYAAYVLFGYSYDFNSTHHWYTGVTIQIIINLETETVAGQFCQIDRAAYEIYSGVLVSYTSQNTTQGCPDLVNTGTVTYELGENQSYFGLEVQLLPSAPEAEYWGYFDAYQNQSIWANETGTWEIAASFEYWIGLSAKTHWTPPSFTLGSVYVWAPEIWDVSDNGALDLDGDLETLDDQYFIKQVYNWHDEVEFEEDYLTVNIVFDPTPNPEDTDDEFVSVNWMGLATQTITYTWDCSFFWYHADDMSPVNATEMADIQELVWHDMTEQIPAPGYNIIAWAARNYSWEDLLDKYWWLEDNTWETSWFGFGQDQAFWLAHDANTTSWAEFRSQYAGLLLFNDNTTIDGGNGVPDFTVQDGFVSSDEVTHFFLIDNVDRERTEFTLPFDSNQDSGSTTIIIDANFDETIDFGVRIYDVNGTLYPLRSLIGSTIRSCYDYYCSPDGLVGLNASMFDYTLSTATIDEMAFDVHYSVLLAGSEENPDPNNNIVSIKVDQYIGDWRLHQFDNSVLGGRSLAIAYYGELLTSEVTISEVSVDGTPANSNNDDTEIGDIYNFGTEGETFAQVRMGGQEYIWGYDGGTYECSAATVPLGVFSAMYQASDGSTIATWEITGNLFFMLSGFINWGGHWIDNDPSFGIYTTALDMVVAGEPDLSWIFALIAVVAVIIAIIAAVIVINIRRRGRTTGKVTEEPVHDYWRDSEAPGTS